MTHTPIISHHHFANFDDALAEIKTRLASQGSGHTHDLEALSQFPLGRFLIQHRGLNGAWTHHICTYPEWRGKQTIHPLEQEILATFPAILATQERFKIFQQAVTDRIKPAARFASIPCGFMGDLLLLNYSGCSVDLTGIDLDDDSLRGAQWLAHDKDIQVHLNKGDAWDLQQVEAFDLICSNGLAIYEPADDRVTQLFRQFYIALSNEGTLVTSYLALPNEWKAEAINANAAARQKVIFADILQARWACLRSEATTRQQLQSAGFSKVEIIPGTAGIFPTVIARRFDNPRQIT